MWRDHLARHTRSVGLVNYIRREVLALRVMKRTEFETVRNFVLWAGWLTIDLEPIVEHHCELGFCRSPFPWRHLPFFVISRNCSQMNFIAASSFGK
jgi:hypothetical protein